MIYIRLSRGRFTPYQASDSIRREFRQIAQNIGIENPYEIALPAIRAVVGNLRALTLNDNFDDFVNYNEFREYLPNFAIAPEVTQVPPLPPQPMPNANVISQNIMPQTITNQGLTPTELALLSPEEQQIRLRQRGLA